MRKISLTLFAVAVVLFGVSAVQATPLINVTQGLSTGGLELFTFSIDNAGGDTYDTINFSVTGGPFNNLENVGGVVNFTPGNDDTDFIGTTLVAVGYTLVGVIDDNNELSGVITTFGGPATDALNGDFAQVVMQPGDVGGFRVDFALQGVQVLDTVTGTIPIPEPATLMLAGMGLIGIVVGRRRR